MFRAVFFLVAVMPAIAPSSVFAQSFGGVGANHGLLLLKNGEILEGDVTRSGDYYLVVAADSELQIRLHDVEAVCRDLEDAYRSKAAKINPLSAEDHTLLAQWCIDRKLFGHAARELTEAYRLDDTHPRIVLLERRLKAAMAESKPMPAAVAPSPASGPTDEQLEQTARSISPEALQEFTVRVQPLLVNYCATAGCHGPKPASKFQLQRVYLNERNDPRLVRVNLHAVMAQLDKQRVGNSPLLTVPLAAHGGSKKPLFTAYNAEHYRVVAAWAARVGNAAGGASSSTASAAPTTVPSPTGALLQRLPIAPPGGETSTPSAPPPAEPTVPPVKPAAEMPNDPFDPAAFNQRSEAAGKP
jgi:hypothetical protein